MSKDKMTEINIGITPTPWVAGGSFPYKRNQGYIFAVTNRPEILVCKVFGSIDENTPPLREQMENSKAIVSAVNNTYGAGISPEQVPDLLRAAEALLKLTELLLSSRSSRNADKTIAFAKMVIEQAKLK